VIRRLLAPFNEFGLGAGFLYLVDRLLNALSPSARLFVYELMVQPTDMPEVRIRALQGFRSREIKPGDTELTAMPVSSAVIESRFAQGAICLGTFKQHRFIGYIWLCFRSYDEDEVRCRYSLLPPEESVFDFDLYIFPESRLGLAFLAIWQNTSALLRSRGVLYSFSRVTRFNLASRRAHAHLGSMRIGRAVFLKLYQVECMASTVFPYVSLSLAAHRPQLRLRADVLLTEPSIQPSHLDGAVKDRR